MLSTVTSVKGVASPSLPTQAATCTAVAASRPQRSDQRQVGCSCRMCGLNLKQLLWCWMLHLLLLLTLVFDGFLIPTFCDDFICISSRSSPAFARLMRYILYLLFLTMQNQISVILRPISLDVAGMRRASFIH